MLFNSAAFIFGFLPITLAGYYLIARLSVSAALAWLNGASLFFYWWGAAEYVPLILVLIVLNYVAALGIVSAPTSRLRYWITFTGVTSNLATIGYFKYTGLVITTINDLSGSAFSIGAIALPLGISFFTFQKIAYLVDAYKTGRAESSINRYSLFVLFFPQLVAGPIVHHVQIIPQFKKDDVGRLYWSNIAIGLSIFTIGLAKKVFIADGIARYSTPVFNAAAKGAAISTVEAWTGALAWSMQIYFDFSGYSDMAIGLARMFGYSLPLNFDSPYKANSIVDFWRRWHMTLSRFLRDYLYIPLGGNRSGWLLRYSNLLVTMLIGGLWHGAAWTFVFWGGLHGIYLIINHWFSAGVRTGFIPKLVPPLLAVVLSRSLTFIAVVVAWVFFRAESWSAAIQILSAMFHLGDERWYAHILIRVPNAAAAIAVLLAVCAWAPNTQQIMGMSKDEPVWQWRPNLAWGAALGAILAACALRLNRPSEFIYFNF